MASPIIVEKVTTDSDLSDDSFRDAVGKLGVQPQDAVLFYSNGNAAEALWIYRTYAIPAYFIPYQALNDRQDWWAVKCGQSWIWSPGV
jgi:hypothetical protein